MKPHTTRRPRKGTEYASVESIIAPAENQPRKELDQAHVRRIADTLRRDGPDLLEPVLALASVTADGRCEYELFDGFHRLQAAIVAGVEHLPAEIVHSREEARQKTALRNNHGLRWTRKDAIAHILQRIREGGFRRHGEPLSLRSIADEYAPFGVKRETLRKRLREAAAEDPTVKQFLADVHGTHSKGDLPRTETTLEELLEAKARQRCEDADRHLQRAAVLLKNESAATLASTLGRFRQYLAKARQRRGEPQVFDSLTLVPDPSAGEQDF